MDTDPQSDELESAGFFVPDPEELRRAAEGIAAQYPPPRLATELVLLEVDPYRTHAYWNIEAADLTAAQAAIGSTETRLVLRVLEPDNATEPYFDVEVEGLQNRWYINLRRGGRSLIAELGVKDAEGTFLAIVSSNRVDLPRGAPPAPPPPVTPLMINLYPDTEPAPPPPVISNVATTPKPAPENPWPSAAEVVRGLPDPAPLLKALLERESTPAPVEMPSGGRYSERAPDEPPPPLPQTISSFTISNLQDFAELEVELHIRGRTRPGSTITFHGETVVTNPDGTFALRKKMPSEMVDGQLRIEPPAPEST